MDTAKMSVPKAKAKEREEDPAKAVIKGALEVGKAPERGTARVAKLEKALDMARLGCWTENKMG